MARETTIRLVDDVDGSEGKETVKFGLRGIDYEVDLSSKNVAALDKALAKYVEAGRRVASPRSSRRRQAATKVDVGAIRSWARENGFEISDRGRIPIEIREAYDAARS